MRIEIKKWNENRNKKNGMRIEIKKME
jgi:hypothetical protein